MSAAPVLSTTPSRVVRRSKVEVVSAEEMDGRRKAEALTQQIAEHLDTMTAAGETFAINAEAVEPLIGQAYDTEIWRDLGFGSWDAYRLDRLPQLLPSPELLHRLRSGGMSQNAIASVTGLTQSAISKRLAGYSPEYSEQDESGAGVDAEKPPAPAAPVKGVDGKTYKPGGGRPKNNAANHQKRAAEQQQNPVAQPQPPSADGSDEPLDDADAWRQVLELSGNLGTIMDPGVLRRRLYKINDIAAEALGALRG